MARGARVVITGDTEKIRTFLKAVNPAVRGQVVDKTLRAIGRRTEALAKEKYIVRGRGLLAPPLKRKLTFRTGFLTRSISTDETRSPNFVLVGSTMRYAPVHELGLMGYPKRKFLEPAAREVIRKEASGLFLKYMRQMAP